MRKKARAGIRPAFTRHFTVIELKHGPHPLAAITPKLQGREFVTLGLHFGSEKVCTAEGREALCNEFARFITHLAKDIGREMAYKVVKMRIKANDPRHITPAIVSRRLGIRLDRARRIVSESNRLLPPEAMRK